MQPRPRSALGSAAGLDVGGVRLNNLQEKTRVAEKQCQSYRLVYDEAVLETGIGDFFGSIFGLLLQGSHRIHQVVIFSRGLRGRRREGWSKLRHLRSNV